MGRHVRVCRLVAAAVHGAEGERRGVAQARRAARRAAAPQAAPRPARLHTQPAGGDYTGGESPCYLYLFFNLCILCQRKFISD